MFDKRDKTRTNGRLLITGGAGYIGSHAVRMMLDAGHSVTVVDDLSTGHRAAVDPRAELVVGDIRDRERMTRLLDGVDAVMHFAAKSIVAESVQDPLLYWDVNVGGSRSLLQAMLEAGVHRLVYSSSAATYGVAESLPISEGTPQRPINPYGSTKLAVEGLIRDVHAAVPEFSSAALRYFNVVGCAFGLGEAHEPETHLLPIVLQAALGQRSGVSIFGTDYDTPDGTCLRDYVHVVDLIDAHQRALEALVPGQARVFNVGLGQAWSVREIIDAVKRVTGRTFAVTEAPRRAGDPPALYTDPTRIQRELGWAPRHPSVDDAIESLWSWFQEHPEGSYAA